MFISQFMIYRFFLHSRSWSKSFKGYLFVEQFSKSGIKKDGKRIPSVSRTKECFGKPTFRSKTICYGKTIRL